MHKNRNIFLSAAVLFVFFIFFGCTTTQEKTASAPEKAEANLAGYQPPEWVNKGSGAFKNTNDKVFYGVGLADNMQNLSLQRTTADDRAIANLATQIRSVVKRLKKEYESITGAGKDTTERVNLDNAMKLLVSETVNGAKIIDHWEHPVKNVLYALARVELKTLQKQIETRKELSDESRNVIKQKAEKLHEEMTKEGL
tara:strand:+ start:194 stop:787 length:594 start_codon:yes stop_codon:yes gene_type:complete